MFDGITRITEFARLRPKARRRTVREVDEVRPRPDENGEQRPQQHRKRETKDGKPLGRRVDLNL